MVRQHPHSYPSVPVGPILSFQSFSKRRTAEHTSILDVGNPIPVTSGRVALALALEKVGVRSGTKVLLPAYNCRSMVDPIKWLSGIPVLYRLKEDLSIDLDDVKRLIDEETKCIIVAHYFGFPQEMKRLRKFCDNHDLALIEDCAHAFFSNYEGKPVGYYGDYAIASAMKFFPIYDGGFLVSSRHSLDGIHVQSGNKRFELKSMLNVLERSAKYKRLQPLNWLIMVPLAAKDIIWRAAKVIRPSLASEELGPNSADGGYSFDSKWLKTEMSLTSRILIKQVAASRIIEKRKRNYENLFDALVDVTGCHPFFGRDLKQTVPYVLPLLVDAPHKVFRRLKSEGFPLYRWEDVDKNVCDISARYSQQLFQIPCHQELRESELSWMTDTIKRIIRES